ncbi:IscS subfamily cysteine desulfurase [Sporosarcina sp. CAU 1771]
MNYFDYAASTPLDAESADVFAKLSVSCYGNTSSLHEVGAEAENLLTYSRSKFAQLLGVSSDGIYFTSGGTESNLLSIISLAKANRSKGNHIVTTLGEHPSIDSALAYLEEDGFQITKIPFNEEGIVDVQTLELALTNETILVSIQHVNPEIGTIQPIEEIAILVKERGILLHSDCVQSFGKMDISAVAINVDSLTISSHKLYGPKGVGLVYIDPKHRLLPVFPGLVHESTFRGGTVNVPGIAAFTTAAHNSRQQLEHFRKLREVFLQTIEKHSDLFIVYTSKDTSKQLPQIVGLRIYDMEGQLMMLELNRRGFAISTGSACNVGQQASSKAMMALRLKPQHAREFVRVSFGKSSTVENVQQLANAMVAIRLQTKKEKPSIEFS